MSQHGHSVTGKTMKSDAQASLAGQLFRTRQHGHSVTGKTMKSDAQASPAGQLFRTRERMSVGLSAWARAVVSAGCAVLIAGCVTSIPNPDDSVTPAEYFQHAQEATARGDYQGALAWYAAFQERHGADESPDQMTRRLWADYETAFLYHKMDDDETALRLLGELVQRYEQPEAASYPAGPRTLAKRVMEELEPSDAEAPEAGDAAAQP